MPALPARLLAHLLAPLLAVLLAAAAPAARAVAINHIDIDPKLGTSGMPTRAQFAAIAKAGYEVVVNLAPDTVLGAHKDEAALVAAQGMAYEHVPVVFASPTVQDYAAFVAALRRHAGRKLLVHCQINMRASTFVYLYRVLERGEDPDRAFEPVQRIWQPDAAWRTLITTLHAQRNRPLPLALTAR
ncbi:MAG: protein tyrosine phosphatase family protein [Betaproteobacteria bacterium]